MSPVRIIIYNAILRRNIMEKQSGFGGISALGWAVIAILFMGAGALIFWLVVVMLFGRSIG